MFYSSVKHAFTVLPIMGLYLIQGYANLRISTALAHLTLQDEDPLLNYNIGSIATESRSSCIRKIQHPGTCLEINTALGFASINLYLSLDTLFHAIIIIFRTHLQQCLSNIKYTYTHMTIQARIVILSISYHAYMYTA